jgi:predicted nucleotidyltransferase
MKPIRLRDFIEDKDGWLYAVATYDNSEKVGCVLRYIPSAEGERSTREGERFCKFDFKEGFDYIRECKPQYLDNVLRIPHSDIKRVLKPENEIGDISRRDSRVWQLIRLFDVPPWMVGCTGSLLCGLEGPMSDIDMVVYGQAWFHAQQRLKQAIEAGKVNALSEDMWRRVYEKRIPEISFETFILHEKRKWNRGEIGGTYFDLLFTRDYTNLESIPPYSGEVLWRTTIEAEVTDAQFAFDNPSVYMVDHDDVTRVLSFTHTYAGQVVPGEILEASGVLEQHGNERWLIVGTTREAKSEYIISKTLMETH